MLVSDIAPYSLNLGSHAMQAWLICGDLMQNIASELNHIYEELQ